MIRVLFILALLVNFGCGNARTADTAMPQSLKTLQDFSTTDDDAIFAIHSATEPWGDYGSMLFHGMTLRLGRKPEPNGELQLERAGPAAPPIFFPSEGILVTDRMKIAMERAGFIGVEFRSVDLTRIVEIDWQDWDLNASEPKFFPEGVSPERYILNRDHSAVAAKAMGPIWELVVAENARLNRVETGDEVTFEYVAGSWQGDDIFRTDGNGYLYVSPRAKLWLKEYFTEWVRFEDCKRH